ncbi:MAG TPA: SRPBCC family protein [Desulfuromonadaceae bacterium]|nr:SRPBCC family protein [Desulfuromonadaceae bacterium]
MKITVMDDEARRSPARARRGGGVKDGAGLKFQKTITINRPVAEVYRFWRNFENLPRFMRHLASVNIKTESISHWAVKTSEKHVLEWDAQLIEDRANELVSWQSLEGADVDNAGSVWFKPAVGNRGTVVKVTLKYAPPGGKFAAKVAKMFGKDAEATIEDDLYRFKSLLETGEIPTVEGQPRGNQKQK